MRHVNKEQTLSSIDPFNRENSSLLTHIISLGTIAKNKTTPNNNGCFQNAKAKHGTLFIHHAQTLININKPQYSILNEHDPIWLLFLITVQKVLFTTYTIGNQSQILKNDMKCYIVDCKNY